MSQPEAIFPPGELKPQEGSSVCGATGLKRFAGGVAHDFNNLLTVINSDASALLAVEGLDPTALESVQRIASAGERAAHLTRQLLLYSGQQPCATQGQDLHELIRETEAALRRLAGRDAAIEFELNATDPFVEIDGMMIEQLLAILVANARDADDEGGRIEIRTRGAAISQEEAIRNPRARCGNFIRLTIADRGRGIAPQDLPQVFDPFFTTRPVGKGTGLGLSVALGIVNLHGGWMEVESVLNSGTQVSVYFPAAPIGMERINSTKPVSLNGRETILLVEDDNLVRETTAAWLKNSGYRVLQADAGQSALEVWKWHSPRIALLLTDVVLPDGVSGIELARKFREERPELRVICTSGFSREMMAQLAHPPDGTFFLQKPSPPAAVLKALRTLLDTPSL